MKMATNSKDDNSDFIPWSTSTVRPAELRGDFPGGLAYSIMANPNASRLSGEIRGDDWSVGADKTVGMPARYSGSYGDVNVSGTKAGVDNISYNRGPLTVETDTKGNYRANYQGDGYDVNASSNGNLNLNAPIPMRDPRNSMNAGVTLGQDREAYVEFHRALINEGYITVDGTLTPEGFSLLFQLGKKF